MLKRWNFLKTGFYEGIMLESAHNVVSIARALPDGGDGITARDLISVTEVLDRQEEAVGAAIQALARADGFRERLQVGRLSSQTADKIEFLDDLRPALDGTAWLLTSLLDVRESMLSGFADDTGEADRMHAALLATAQRSANLRVALDGSSRLSSLLDSSVERADEALSDLELAMRFLIDSMGFDGRRVHLVLAQDDEEMRPSGGFIGALWEIAMERGTIADQRFLSSYAVDENVPISEWDEAPESFKIGMGSPVIPFRDQNWWPDFPTSAARLRETYSRAQGIEPSLVVAINQTVIESILLQMGPLVLGSASGDKVDTEAVRAYLRQGRPVPPGEPRFAGWDDERYATYVLGEALLARFELGDSQRIARIFEGILGAAAEGDLVVSARDLAGADLFSRLGWDGAVPDFHSDGFYWVESSLYGRKTSQDVGRSFDYQVTLDANGGATGRLTVRYENPPGEPTGPCVQPSIDNNPPCYWMLFRLYLPAGTVLTQQPSLPLPETALVVPAREPGMETVVVRTGADGFKASTVEVSGLAVVEPDATGEWTFAYTLRDAASVVDGTWTYSLELPRQPGVRNAAVDVTVHLPPGACATSTTPEAARQAPELAWPFPPGQATDVSVKYSFDDGCQ